MDELPVKHGHASIYCPDLASSAADSHSRAGGEAGLDPPESEPGLEGCDGRARGRFTRNFVVQATAAEWAFVSLATLRAALAGTTAEIVLFVHDEVVVHCPGRGRRRGARRRSGEC
jgi:hypothetical protein